MARHIRLNQLYEDNREKLLLNWVVGQRVDRRIEIRGASNYGADVVGHVNIIHPERMQVMGRAEYDWRRALANVASRIKFRICCRRSPQQSSSPTG